MKSECAAVNEKNIEPYIFVYPHLDKKKQKNKKQTEVNIL